MMKIDNFRMENSGGNIYMFYGVVNGNGFAINSYGEGGWYPFDYNEDLNWKGDDYVGGMDDTIMRYITTEESINLLSEIANNLTGQMKEIILYSINALKGDE